MKTREEPGPLSDVLKLSQELKQAFGHKQESPKVVSEGDVERLREMVRHEMAKVRGESPSAFSIPEQGGLVRFLVGKGLDVTLAQQIEGQVEERLGALDLKLAGEKRTRHFNALKEELAKHVQVFGPIALASAGPTLVALVGPTGVGKTTAVAKLAGFFAQREHKKVSLISLDALKAGSAEQLASLASSVGCPWTMASSSQQFREAVAHASEADLVLIDTAGRSPYHWQDVDLLGDMLSAVPGVQVHLVISAVAKDVDVYGTIEHFGRLESRSVLFTKLDETIAHGILINVCEKMGVKISYLCAGRLLSDDLRVADAEDIARGLLLQHNASQWETLRQLSLQGNGESTMLRR